MVLFNIYTLLERLASLEAFISSHFPPNLNNEAYTNNSLFLFLSYYIYYFF